LRSSLLEGLSTSVSLTRCPRAAVWEKLAEILLTNDAFAVIKGAKKT
jgi:hypothetical protein